MLPRISIVAFTIMLGACVDGQSEFTDGRTLDPCDETVPVCTTTASCVLDGTNYAQGSFEQGATQRIVVNTIGAAQVTVQLFFVTEVSPGIDTEITFYEVDCTDPTDDMSNGADIFQQAGPDRIYQKTQQFLTAGDHLIEVFSDSQASYLLRVLVDSDQ